MDVHAARKQLDLIEWDEEDSGSYYSEVNTLQDNNRRAPVGVPAIEFDSLRSLDNPSPSQYTIVYVKSDSPTISVKPRKMGVEQPEITLNLASRSYRERQEERRPPPPPPYRKEEESHRSRVTWSLPNEIPV